MWLTASIVTSVSIAYAAHMMSELQRLVDGLGDRLGRSVAIDDWNLRLLAYNSHDGPVDEARVASIMRREVRHELVEFMRSLGGFDETDLFQHPVRPDLGLTIARIGMPIRHEGVVHGFLWLMASEGVLDDIDDLDADAIRDTAKRAGEVLQRDRLLDELRLAKVREYLRDLLSGNADILNHAAERIVEEDLLSAGSVSALVVAPARPASKLFSEETRLALAIALEQSCRQAPPRSAIHLERVDHGVVVMVHSGPDGRQDAERLAAIVHHRVCAAMQWPAEECLVGIGERRTSLADVQGSYNEAKRAFEVARVVPGLGTVVQYARLGVYGLLAELPMDRLQVSIHPGLQRLLEYDAKHRLLLNTLEVFLNNAGDVKRTAEQLSIHRASTHYRLRRIEEIAQISLSSGDDRLAMHLSLKVASLVDPPLRGVPQGDDTGDAGGAP